MIEYLDILINQNVKALSRIVEDVILFICPAGKGI